MRKAAWLLAPVILLAAAWRWNTARRAPLPPPGGTHQVTVHPFPLRVPDTTLAAAAFVPRMTGPLPALIFAPGMGVRGDAYRTFLTDVASRGFLVVAIPHPRMPAGEDTPLISAQPIFAKAIVDVLRAVLALRATGDSIAARIDTTRVAAFGHSIGGAGAAEACSLDPRVRAAVDLDGSLYGKVVHEGVACPFLLIERAPGLRLPFAAPPTFIEERAQGQLHQDSVRAHTRVMEWVTLRGLEHMSFLDSALRFETRTWLREWPGLRMNAHRVQRISADLVSAFFTRHLAAERNNPERP